MMALVVNGIGTDAINKYDVDVNLDLYGDAATDVDVDADTDIDTDAKG